MQYFPARLSGSRVAYALGLGNSRYGTPLQVQQQLLGLYTPDPIDGDDPTHPAVQGQKLEAGILELSALAWAKRHGHPIRVDHVAAAFPRTKEDPAGGLLLNHPTQPLSCHPDAFFICDTCQQAWLVDAKRYSSSQDAEAAKDELRTQLAFNLMICKAVPELHNDGLILSDTALGAVLRIDAFREQGDDGVWSSRAVITPDCLEVPCSPELLARLEKITSDWMRLHVLPWYEGEEVPAPEPMTYEDVCLLWPAPTPDKHHVPDGQLIALIDEHKMLTEAQQGAQITQGEMTIWWTSEQIEARRKELRTAILLATQDAECVALDEMSDVICTLKADRFGNRHVKYDVKGYNQKRAAARKRAAKGKA